MTKPSFYEYLNYQVGDFVMDQGFQEWVRHPNTSTDQFWQQFLMTYPEKREQVEEAMEIIRSIHYQAHTLTKEKQESMLQKVYKHAEKSRREKRKTAFFPFPKKYMTLAATVSLLMVAAFIFWLSYFSYKTYETGYQENRTIQLSDGSEVSLNANTSIKVKMDVQANQPREVWLEGEAYFHVKRLNAEEAEQYPDLKKFIVHADNFDIEVLGTTFNVTSRSKKSEVLLKSGKVKVASQQIEQTQILQPGDLLTLSTEDSNFQLKKAEPEKDLAWRENFFIFENTPLLEVAQAIENYYGIKVNIANQQLEDKIFTAKVSRNELPMLLKAIEVSFGVKVTSEKDIIRIEP